MNTAEMETRILELNVEIAIRRKRKQRISHLLDEQKGIRNKMLAVEKIKDFVNGTKAKQAAVKQRVDEGIQDKLHRRPVQYSTAKEFIDKFEFVHPVPDCMDPQPTTWEKVKNFLARWFA